MVSFIILIFFVFQLIQLYCNLFFCPWAKTLNFKAWYLLIPLIGYDYTSKKCYSIQFWGEGGVLLYLRAATHLVLLCLGGWVGSSRHTSPHDPPRLASPGHCLEINKIPLCAPDSYAANLIRFYKRQVNIEMNQIVLAIMFGIFDY